MSTAKIFVDTKTLLEGNENGVPNTERFMTMVVTKDDGSLASITDKIKFIHNLKNCDNKSNQPVLNALLAENGDKISEDGADGSHVPVLLINGKSHNILYAMDPSFRGQCIIDGHFSAIHFDLQIEQWKNKPSDLIHRIEVLKEDPTKTFRRDVKRFAKEITQRLFKVFKFEIPVPTTYVVATIFTCNFPQLETIYQQFRKVLFPKNNAPVDFVVSIIPCCCKDLFLTNIYHTTQELLKDMIKNGFKYRSITQKKEGTWPIRASAKYVCVDDTDGTNLIASHPCLLPPSRAEKRSLDTSDY